MALRAGFVGCGNITDTHVRAAREAGIEPAAFAARDPHRAEEFAARFGGRGCRDYDELLAQPIDLVVIGSPSGLHAAQGVAAAERGLHVLVEKPIDVSVERGRALVEASERKGVRLGVMFQDRLKPELLRARELVAGGGLGRVLLASARVKWYRDPGYYSSSSWRGTRALDGGAALINQAIHTLDLLLWLLGPVSRVRAATATRLHAIECEDVAFVLLEFASGALASFEATTVAWPGYPRRVEISGSEGTLVLEGDRIAGADLRTPSPQVVSGPGAQASAASAVVSDASAHRRLFEDFVRAIRACAAPACDGREGLRSLAVVEAAYAAARQRGLEVA